MNNDFHIATLTNTEKEKLQSLEEEMGKVLIVWEKEEQNKQQNSNM